MQAGFPWENVDLPSFYVIWQEIPYPSLLEDITKKQER